MGKGVNRILATQSPLPVYTPELNRIEGMWSVLKHCIRQFSRAGKYGMEQRIQTALLLIDPFNLSCWERSWG
jgi:transposase